MGLLENPYFLAALALATGFILARRRRPAACLYVQRHDGDVGGCSVQLHTLTNQHGMSVSLSDFGATLTSVRIPDVRGLIGEITLGHDHLRGYVEQNCFLGSSVGRYANRIAEGKFSIDGQAFSLAANNHGQHLHGGLVGFDRKIWQAKVKRTDEGQSVVFTYVSPDGEEGYPGKLEATITYTLLDDCNELQVQFAATTDAPTICNLTNHAFFNLAGEGTALRHHIQIFSERFAAVNPSLISTGEFQNVEGTPFDFRSPHAIGERIGASYMQLQRARGYDHCYDLGTSRQLQLAARVSEPSSGRIMELLTDAPGLQFYSGNFLDGTIQGRWPRPFMFRDGFCLEPGLFPDSPNQPAFHRLGYPSGILRPGEQYSQKLIFRFDVVRQGQHRVLP